MSVWDRIGWTPRDPELAYALAGVLGLLAVASLIVAVVQRRVETDAGRALAANLVARTKAWWVMCAVLGLTLLSGGVGSVILFALTSFFALREFVTLSPTSVSDHETLAWSFFVFVPLQYLFVGLDEYGMMVLLIPVYAFLFVPIRSVLAGNTDDFLARTGSIQWGLMICVYCVSYAPALLSLPIPGYEGEGVKLLMFLIIVVQLSDVLQYVFGKTLGRRKLAPTVSPNKTWEGMVGGVLAASAVGTALWWMTPFAPWQAAVVSLVITLAGVAGGLVMSAIKRDRGVKDFGASIPGHGGVLDRIDSVCFAAPLFFHLTRWWLVM